MITPKELLEKCEKLFPKIVVKLLQGEEVFPLTISGNKKISGINYSEIKADVLPLFQNSKENKGYGYSIEWKEKKINGSKQKIPVKIFFESFDDYLGFIKRKYDFEKILEAQNLLTSVFPQLIKWTKSNPITLLNNSGLWANVIKVCRFFVENTPPYEYYLRELPIEVHTKFIEENVSIIKTILDLLLPSEKKSDSDNDFSARYFLKKASIYTQIRILDDELKPHLGYNEIALTLDDAAWLDWLPDNVFIIENKTCYLTFPKVKNSVAIFGEGFKSRLSKHIPWLAKTKVYCWFDLDAAGFEMLNIIRQYYQNAQSILMDRETLEAFMQFAVENKSKPKQLPFLNNKETVLYQFLSENKLRLEQERISQLYVRERVARI
ncbi:MAG TPA: DUF2220 family protein [Chitinophagaceae bacterium]|jgi:hypothetical protein|nr:DUF2220 family protein [Chitinophagaceae bacterium]